jgi:hypothetical protein
MWSKRDAQALLAETLAWTIYTYDADAAQWADECGRILLSLDLLPRDEWEEQCRKWWSERSEHFRNPNRFGPDGEPPLSSPAL